MKPIEEEWTENDVLNAFNVVDVEQRGLLPANELLQASFSFHEFQLSEFFRIQP